MIVNSVRIAPCEPFKKGVIPPPGEETPRPVGAAEEEVAYIRGMLDERGLSHVEIWQRPYKPPAMVYIDDRAIRFNGDWSATLEEVLEKVAGPVKFDVVKDADPRALQLQDYIRRQPDPPTMTEASVKENFSRKVQLKGAWFTREDEVNDASEYARTEHPGSARFHEILEELGDLHNQKNKDYGRDDDPFANVRASTDWDMPAWVGAMVRAQDKIRRLQTFARKGELANESVVDSFKDLAVYAIIALCLYEEEKAPGSPGLRVNRGRT